jgi:hypothetical protein
VVAVVGLVVGLQSFPILQRHVATSSIAKIEIFRVEPCSTRIIIILCIDSPNSIINQRLVGLGSIRSKEDKRLK